MVLRFKVFEVGIGDLRSSSAQIDLEDKHHLRRVGVREWTDEHAIHDAEYCSAGADAQGQREHCNRRDASVPYQHSNTVTDVLPQSLHLGFRSLLGNVGIQRGATWFIPGFLDC